MQEIILDCAKITDKSAMHKALAKALHFPEWYGGNLDALYDCLTSLDTPAHLILQNFTDPGGFKETMLDAADTDLGFSVTFA